MNIIRQNLDHTAAPVTVSDHIFLTPDGTLTIVLDEDIYDEFIGED